MDEINSRLVTAEEKVKEVEERVIENIYRDDRKKMDNAEKTIIWYMEDVGLES